MMRSQTMRLLQCALPRETEMGSAGEQPIKGYLGGARQDDGQGVGTSCSLRAPFQAHRIDRPLMPEKTRNNEPQTCVQGIGRGTMGPIDGGSEQVHIGNLG